MKPFCQPWREAVQIASGSLSNSHARMVAPIGPIPRKVTPIPWGKQTTCWYFHPVAKITNSVTVAMRSNGMVRYEMRLLFRRCHGENPVSFGAAGWEESGEFGAGEFFIKSTFRTRPCPLLAHYDLCVEPKDSDLLLLPIIISIDTCYCAGRPLSSFLASISDATLKVP